jgi:phage gp29-like protein
MKFPLSIFKKSEARSQKSAPDLMIATSAAATPVMPAAPKADLIQPKISDFAPMFWANRRLDPSQIRWVLQNAAQGSLTDQYELFSLMEDTWPRLLKNLAEVRSNASRGKFTIQPYTTGSEKPTDSAKEKADLVEAALKNWRPRPGTLELGFEDALFHALDAYGKGISVLEIGWSKNPDGILPRAAHMLSPRRYGWSPDGTELGLLGSGSTVWTPTPTSSSWEPFPAGQFWCGIWQARSGAPGATALLRALAPYWVGITFGWEWLLATAQIFGVPFRWATYDPSRPELLGTLTQMLQQMATAGYAAFPAGTTLDFKDAVTRSQDNPQILIQNLADKACDLLILGQEASGQAHSGNALGGGGMAQLQGEVRREVLHSAAQWCANLLNYQLVPAILQWNWGDVSETPTVVPDLAGDPDPVQVATRDQVLSTIPGVRFVAAEFYERHGLSKPEAGDETIGGTPATPGFPPKGGVSSGMSGSAPGGTGSPGSGPGNAPQTAQDRLGGDSIATMTANGLIVDPPRSAIPRSDALNARESGQSGGASAMPGDYRMPEATAKALARAQANDMAPLRKAAQPLLAAIEAGNLDVVGELEAFIAHLDALAPKMIGASELADVLEAGLSEAMIAGAAHSYSKLPNAKEPNAK